MELTETASQFIHCVYVAVHGTGWDSFPVYTLRLCGWTWNWLRQLPWLYITSVWLYVDLTEAASHFKHYICTLSVITVPSPCCPRRGSEDRGRQGQNQVCGDQQLSQQQAFQASVHLADWSSDCVFTPAATHAQRVHHTPGVWPVSTLSKVVCLVFELSVCTHWCLPPKYTWM